MIPPFLKTIIRVVLTFTCIPDLVQNVCNFVRYLSDPASTKFSQKTGQCHQHKVIKKGLKTFHQEIYPYYHYHSSIQYNYLDIEQTKGGLTYNPVRFQSNI